MEKIEFTTDQITSYLTDNTRSARHSLVLVESNEKEKHFILKTASFGQTTAKYLIDLCTYFDCTFVIYSADEPFTIALYQI